jgi:hypothetical protein
VFVRKPIFSSVDKRDSRSGGRVHTGDGELFREVKPPTKAAVFCHTFYAHIHGCARPAVQQQLLSSSLARVLERLVVRLRHVVLPPLVHVNAGNDHAQKHEQGHAEHCQVHGSPFVEVPPRWRWLLRLCG